MRRRRRIRIRDLLIAAGLVAGLALATALTSLIRMPVAGAAAHRLAGNVPDHVTIVLHEKGDSGIAGKATLRADDGVTIVAIRLTGPDGSYPAYIHEGACDDFEAMPGFPLADGEPGRITRTVVEISLADLFAGAYVINVHRPTTDLAGLLDPASVVACGTIAVANASTGGAAQTATHPPVTGVGSTIAREGAGVLTVALGAFALALAAAGVALRPTERRPSPFGVV